MFDGSLVFTYSSFQPCETPQHKHIVGVHLVGAACIRERFGIAIHLAAQQNAPPSQRVAKRIRTVQFDRTRGRPRGFPKGMLPIHRHLKEQSIPRAKAIVCSANTLLGSIASASLASRIA